MERTLSRFWDTGHYFGTHLPNGTHVWDTGTLTLGHTCQMGHTYGTLGHSLWDTLANWDTRMGQWDTHFGTHLPNGTHVWDTGTLTLGHTCLLGHTYGTLILNACCITGNIFSIVVWYCVLYYGQH